MHNLMPQHGSGWPAASLKNSTLAAGCGACCYQWPRVRYDVVLGRPIIFRGGWPYEPSLENRAHFQRRLMPPPGPRNSFFRRGWRHHLPLKMRLIFRSGWNATVPSSCCRSGYVCTRPWKKNRAFLEIVSVVLKIKFNFYQLICFYQMFNKIWSNVTTTILNFARYLKKAYEAYKKNVSVNAQH